MEVKIVKRIVIFFPLIIMIFGCGGLAEPEEKSEEAKDFEEYVDFPIRHLGESYFFDIAAVNEYECSIKWGIREVDTFNSNDVFEYDSLREMTYLTSNDEFIFFRQSCGTNCSFIAVLPLKGGGESIVYNPICLDLKRNWIAYCKDGQNTLFLLIRDLKNKNEVEIEIKDICPSALPHACVKNAFFNSDGLHLEWEGKGWENWDNPDFKEKLFPVKF